MKSLGEDFPEIWMRDDQKSNLLVKTKKLIRFGIVFLDSRLVPTELNGVFSRLPPIPRRDFGANDIDVIVKMVLKQSRRSHHNRLVLPSIKINNCQATGTGDWGLGTGPGPGIGACDWGMENGEWGMGK